ncbi:hypothetical protein ACRALDRAFT_1081382 [Sodiomyces alcalophilus JCM 7366]|uniref:uncharacterized protein n=1 Tax=Sodiomyces alcalophilus JCM 7366 TaxID=591952 RepID=UPI0039B40F4E
MAAMRRARVPVGSASWITDERASALSFAEAEVQEFAFSAHNDVDWLNEHMADVFNENEINVAEIFKTPGKLRGKTPRTTRKLNNGEPRVPLSDVFSSASKGAPTPFAHQLNRLQSPRRQISPMRNPLAVRNPSPLKPVPSPRPQPSKHVLPADSGYYGSQSQDAIDGDLSTQPMQAYSPSRLTHGNHHVGVLEDEPVDPQSPTATRAMQSPTMTFQTAREEQTTRAVHSVSHETSSTTPHGSPARSPMKEIPAYPIISPQKARLAYDSSPKRSSPLRPIRSEAQEQQAPDADEDLQGDHAEEARSPSEGSSPIRPVVRKSSLNFASLPAREPLTSKRSLGQRQSRTSYDNRASYFGRHTGGKSLGNVSIQHESDDDDDFNDGMDIDDKDPATHDPTIADGFADTHNKTYTQRLQDQISLLGKSQPNAGRQSRSVHSSTASQQPAQGSAVQSTHEDESSPARSPVRSPVHSPVQSPIRSPIRSPMRSPAKRDVAPRTPGAFPEDDDEEDWIAPPAVPEKDVSRPSPLPTMAKSHSADVMEGVHEMSMVGGAEFVLPKQRQLDSRPASPQRQQTAPDRVAGTPGHGKSASVSVLPSHRAGRPIESPQKGISVSNPTLASGSEVDRPATPKSPSRVFRDSPLKQVKNKLSSIIKSSRGLLASSAAISAEGKSSLLSPSTTRLAHLMNPSTDSISKQATNSDSLYPNLSQQLAPDAQSIASMTMDGSPTRPIAKRTRASAEREREEKRKEKEAQKEARLMAEQMDKLDKARQKEREKARDFSKEQEKLAAMEKKLAAQREPNRQAPPMQTPVAKDGRASRMSPRKARAPAGGAATANEDADVEMADVPASMPPPPSVPRSAGPSQATRGREIRRPVKPPFQSGVKSKQAPTVIRVNTGSQHSQYHPSNSALSSNLHDTLGPSQHQLRSKASQASLHNKPSLQSLRGAVASSGRPKALELAAKRKEQEEKEAQRKREAKMEMDRKRAAAQEEEKKQELQRRQEAERQKEKEREMAAAQAEARKKAAIERAKQTRAPPPAVRSQPNGPPDYAATQQDRAAQRADGPPRPPSRATMTNQRSQEDASRPVNAVLSHGAKVPPKRPLPQDGSDRSSRNPQARNGPSYQAKDAKRRRTSDDFMDELDMESQPPHIKGPPVRPSGGFKKDMPSKAPYSNGYSNAPSQNSSRDLFKATVTAQHNSAVKSTHPMDMSQFSKGTIPFAPNPKAGGPSHKTPARTPGMAAAKSTAKAGTRSSPRFQNGESIELPEIETDDDDEDEDEAPLGAAAWADSPDLRRALMRQETMDPALIFGPPAPLNMEEVFSKSKDRWHKFRARTSSANWSGPDRLTEEEVQRDLAARDKLRKEGGWSYEVSKDLV